ncbi:unnamed protein product, partial [Didymodactylos carnosus]
SSLRNFTTTTREVTLFIENRSTFTIHYALWPLLSLILLIIGVWLSIYLMTTFCRSQHGQRKNFASYYTTQESTMGEITSKRPTHQENETSSCAQHCV